MRLAGLFAFAAALQYAFAAPMKRGVTAALMTDFDLYTRFASAAYWNTCPKPVDSELVELFNDDGTNTQGLIARNDDREEIVVSFRGSLQLQDFLTDLDIILVDYASPGVQPSVGSQVHQGFLGAFNSVAANITATVKAQLDAHPGYSLVSTGHSLGGALASLGGVSLKANFPKSSVRIYTFGQPRTGNPAYADFVEKIIGATNIYRTVHTWDGVPTMLPEALGYQHHSVEFWNFEDPPNAQNVKMCAGNEDPTCSDSIVSTGINIPHLQYFGHLMALDPSLCGRGWLS